MLPAEWEERVSCREEPKRVPGISTSCKKSEADVISAGWDCFIRAARGPELCKDEGWEHLEGLGTGYIHMHTNVGSSQGVTAILCAFIGSLGGLFSISSAYCFCR